MNKPNILNAAYIVGVALVGLWLWRSMAGLATQNPATEPLGKAMLSISG